MQLRRRVQQLVFLFACAATMWLTFPREASAWNVFCEECDDLMLSWAVACPNSNPGDPPNCSGQPTGYFESETCRSAWINVYRCYDCPWCRIGF